MTATHTSYSTPADRWALTQDIALLIPAVYHSISGAAQAPRDWDLFRFLHRADSRSLRTVAHPDGRLETQVFDVESYIANVAPFFAANDFHEIEVAQTVTRYGQVAHVWSRYEARAHPDDTALLKRGANSIQLTHDGRRWWIFSTIWDNWRDEEFIDTVG